MIIVPINKESDFAYDGGNCVKINRRGGDIISLWEGFCIKFLK